MIIHMWMHWFWITTVFFKGWLFFAVQMISLSCIPHTSAAEAGLLLNETFINQTSNLYEETNSSQIQLNPNITSLPIGETHPPPENTSHRSSTSSPLLVTTTQTAEEESTTKPEDISRIASEITSDMEDTYNGGSVDLYQYPLKKFAKYSFTKYGKLRAKGKHEEPSGEEKKIESVKIVEEKLNINLSTTGDSLGRTEQEVDKLNVSVAEGNISEIPKDTVDPITTTIKSDNATVEISNTTESPNVTFVSSTEEIVLKDEPPKLENVTSFSSTAIPDIFLNSTEDQKDVILKNESLVIENKVEESRTFTTVEPFIVRNRVAAATSAQNFEVEQAGLNAGSITGITLGILVIFSLFGAVSFVLYRRRYLNKPQVLHDKCSNLDSSGYIDDTSLRENSEEMYSLDNDSFLNSLEAMTIQNYWTENVKHTKL